MASRDALPSTLVAVKTAWYRSTPAAATAAAVVTLTLSVVPIYLFVGWYEHQNGPIDGYLLEYWGVVAATTAVIAVARVVLRRVSRAASSGIFGALLLFIFGATLFYWLLHIVIA
jgi:hypothetical protein